MFYLFAAFTVVWMGLFTYLIFLATRQKQLLEEIKILKESITKEESTKAEARNNFKTQMSK